MTTKRCAKCGRVFDAVFFRFNRGAYEYAHDRRRAICKGCEQTARDQRKQRDRWSVKVRDMVRRHASRLKVTTDELVNGYGWDVEQMRHEAEHAYGNGCPYCQTEFKTMGHGLHDLTIDIVDPQAAPYYTTNTRYCCQSCNREKSRTPPELWARLCLAWKQWSVTPSLPVPEQMHLF